jgi:hypothetical protein
MMKNKIAFWIITLGLTIFILYIAAFTIIKPVFTTNALPKTFPRTTEKIVKSGKDEIKKQEDEPITSKADGNANADSVHKLLDLKRKEILLRSRFLLASDDSMYLILDLINDLAILELKGISLHECHILHKEISSSIKSYSADALLNWSFEPFEMKTVDATIPKISFIEKIAPKDTLEANKMVTEPKEAKLGDVFIVMEFDRNLRLVISQNEKPDSEGEKIITDLQRKYSKAEISRSIQALLNFSREPVKPQIEIIIPKSDATILYKALPFNPRMILRM